jgi:cell division protein FtsL
MTTARATQPVSRRSPIERRPALRVVDTRRDGTPRSLTHLIGTVLAVVLFASVFSVVTCQVLLVQTQSRLDDVDARIAQEQAAGKQLGRDIAAMESPERIVDEAKDRLDMVPAGEPGYLQPQPDDDARAALSGDPSAAADDRTLASGGADR